jgi:hypothetical protein
VEYFKIAYRSVRRKILLFSSLFIISCLISIIFTASNIGGYVAVSEAISEIAERGTDIDMIVRINKLYGNTSFDIIEGTLFKSRVAQIQDVVLVDFLFGISSPFYFITPTLVPMESYPNTSVPPKLIPPIYFVPENSSIYKEIGFKPNEGEALMVCYNQCYDIGMDKLDFGNYSFKIVKISFVKSLDKYYLFSFGQILMLNYNTLDLTILNKININEMDLYVYINHSRVIKPNDLNKTIETLNQIKNKIMNLYNIIFSFNDKYIISIIDILKNKIESIRNQYSSFLFGFIFLSLPLIFITIYLASSLGDFVFSFKLRDIALYKIRGFNIRKIFIINLLELIFIIVLGSLLGYFLSPLLVAFSFNYKYLKSLEIAVNNVYAFSFAILIGFIVALLAFIKPLRENLKKPIIYALQPLQSSGDKPYKKIRVWASFVLGTYKIAIWIFNVKTLDWLFYAIQTQNFALAIFFYVLNIIDFPLNLLGPFLFIYGVSKLFSYHAPKLIEKLVSSLKLFIKDFSILAAKNISRNKARNSLVIFTISLIVFYSLFNITILSTVEDYAIRLAYYSSGSDITLVLTNSSNIDVALNKIKNFEEVKMASLAYLIRTNISDILAVNTEEFLKVCYYENEWFKGGSPEELMKKLDANSIILNEAYAKNGFIKIGQKINVRLVIGNAYNLTFTVIGFIAGSTDHTSLYLDLEKKNLDYEYSLISTNNLSSLQEQISIYNSDLPFRFGFISIINIDSIKNLNLTSQPIILIKLNSIELTNVVINKIQNEIKNVLSIITFKDKYNSIREQYSSTIFRQEYINFQTIISIILIALGVSSVALITLYEKSRIISLQYIRGINRKQLFIVNFFAMFGTLIISILIGALAAYATVLGYTNIIPFIDLSYGLIKMRIIILPSFYIYVASIIIGTFLSLIIPLILFIKRIQAQVEELI